MNTRGQNGSIGVSDPLLLGPHCYHYSRKRLSIIRLTVAATTKPLPSLFFRKPKNRARPNAPISVWPGGAVRRAKGTGHRPIPMTDKSVWLSPCPARTTMSNAEACAVNSVRALDRCPACRAVLCSSNFLAPVCEQAFGPTRSASSPAVESTPLFTMAAAFRGLESKRPFENRPCEA